MAQAANRKLTIFVHRASECLTDHEPHGDGLICFSLLNGLAQRGHKVFAYANRAPIHHCHPNLQVRTARHRVPANSLADWEHAWRAERWFGQLLQQNPIDMVWRMHPYGGCLHPPRTQGRTLVIGPLFHGWPAHLAAGETTGRPRLGVGIGPYVHRTSERTWQATLKRAKLLLCATVPLEQEMQAQFPGTATLHTPVIVDAPANLPPGENPQARSLRAARPFRLLLVAGLVSNKHPRLFVDTVRLLRAQGLNVEGVLIGDGLERADLQTYCAAQGLQESVVFRGKLPHADVWSELQQADVLVSCSGFEAYGRSIVEAMALGVPCVCYAGSGGPAEFITNGADGALVKELTPEAYARTIGELVASPPTWQALACGALHTAQQWRSETVLSQLELALFRICPAASMPGA